MVVRPILVTGAGGFIGSRLVAGLHRRGIAVRAGVRRPGRTASFIPPEVPVSGFDMGDAASMAAALRGVGRVFHFAALVDGHAPLAHLREANVDGTRRLLHAAADAGVDQIVYCSTTAVYGLAAARNGPIGEETPPRALESYGRTKMEGEKAARDVADQTGMDLIILRPAAVFGVGEQTGIGQTLRQLAVSRVIMPGTGRDWTFSYVHVDDVVRAVIHVAGQPECAGRTFNVALEPPVPFSVAFAAYRRAVRRAGMRRWRERLLASFSALAQDHTDWPHRIPASLRRHWLQGLWQPGWDLTYSSARLRATGFQFVHTDFTAVLSECLGGQELEFREISHSGP